MTNLGPMIADLRHSPGIGAEYDIPPKQEDK